MSDGRSLCVPRFITHETTAVEVAVGLAGLEAEKAPAAAGGNVAQLLHVGVQQVAGRGVLVAHDLALAALEAGPPAKPAGARGRGEGHPHTEEGLLTRLVGSSTLADRH